MFFVIENDQVKRASFPEEGQECWFSDSYVVDEVNKPILFEYKPWNGRYGKYLRVLKGVISDGNFVGQAFANSWQLKIEEDSSVEDHEKLIAETIADTKITLYVTDLFDFWSRRLAKCFDFERMYYFCDVTCRKDDPLSSINGDWCFKGSEPEGEPEFSVANKWLVMKPISEYVPNKE